MGTVLSSPKDNRSYWTQLRASKSTFSLKDRNAGSSGSSGSLFRHTLPGSVSIRKLSQSSLGRRKDKQPQQQQQQQQQQQPSISTISSASCWANDAAKTPELKPSDRRNNNCHVGACRQSRSALTKSTSCYAIKAAAPKPQTAKAHDGKENEEGGDNRRLVVQASTSDLLKCMGAFLRQQSGRVACEPSVAIAWIRSVDRSLILQGWADIAFVNPPNLVFLFMLAKSAVTDDISSERQLQATLLTCMYVAYSYMGNEISYPLKPFLIDDDRDAFWDRCLSIINSRSSDMLKINSDPTFFIDLFTELKSYS